MSTYIYGSDELALAIERATHRNISERLAQDFLHRAWERAGWEGIKECTAGSGVNTVVNELGYPVFYTVEEIEGATAVTAPTLYTGAVESTIDAGTNEVVISNLAQKATEGGTKLFTAGGVQTLTTALSVIGAVATGVELGWESYKEHPDFWTDLSESIFNSNKSPDTPIEVLARAHAGGYTTGVKEEGICKILKGLAEQGAFNYNTYESTIDSSFEGGYIDVNFTQVSPQGLACSLAYAKAQEVVPNGTVICVRPDIQVSDEYIHGVAVICNNTSLPTYADVYKATEPSPMTGYYFATRVSSVQVVVQMSIADHTQYTYSITNVNYEVPSGIKRINSDSYEIGGLNVITIEHEGDNDLFPNNNSPLSIAPTTPVDIIGQYLRDTFPDWYNDSWVQPEYDPITDTVENVRYYPITIPWWNPSDETEKPPAYTPSEAQKGDLKQEPDPKAEPQGKQATKNNNLTDEYLDPIVPTPPSPPTPPFIPDVNDDNSTALWSVYNPTMQELNDLGAYLWSSNVIDILQKFLQNPMDAIISLHKVYCTPTRGNRKNIILGYLDSGVTAITVTKQFVTVDCGSVDVAEYFADARDYDTPYTTVECYLPFIGIVRLKTEDIIGGKVNIVYTVDLYSGACLAKIYVTKIGVKQLLYNYSGNSSMQIPLTGSDRTRLLSGAISGAISGAVMGAHVGAIAGAVAGAWMGGTSIERTSNFSANAGCMGVKTPYLIITRKYSYDAGRYNEFYGYPSNITVQLNTCKGFTKVKSVHIQNILRATDNEKNTIEILLKQGVIIK